MPGYARGLSELGHGCFAYLQPDGSWGWSNAGLVADGDASLLVDTLFDVRLTAEMLAAMRRAVPAARHIDTVVNTHANGDHCWGNELVRDSEIIASRSGAEEMGEFSPALMAKLTKVARIAARLGPFGRALGAAMGKVGIRTVGTVIEAAPYLMEIFGSFEFQGIELVLPNRTFDDHLALSVGDRRVELFEVGPAHTRGDVLVHVPDARVVYTGDILFIEGHPIVWQGPFSNWIAACERIEAMDVHTIVPGHGPLTDVEGVRRLSGYLAYVHAEAKERHAAGMSAFEAALDIDLSDYAGWSDEERIVVNVATVYRELTGDPPPASVVPLFGQMAAYARRR